MQSETPTGPAPEKPQSSAAGRSAFMFGAVYEPEALPDRIGPYKIVRELGRGGMGSVLLGQRDDGQFRRRVAIKLIRRGMDTEDILQRFHFERQVLATLDHPNIVRLLDAGSTADGRPYFVMEYIEGQPIDEYCDAENMDTRGRLSLFKKVCNAVHYAHQRLIVHRDIKPSNIIVTPEGDPKLLDFGIAKILNAGVFQMNFQTAPDMRLMTAEYASPEQVRGRPLTTATDIYSLGVVLYQLLTGHLPYRLKERVQSEIENVICNEDPVPPSTAISQAWEIETRDGSRTLTADEVARVRDGATDRLRKRLVGDIDTIVLHALRKKPEERYVSAEQFGTDIENHLVGNAVIARRPTWSYRAAKFIRRNKGLVAAALAVFVALSAGLAGTSWQWRRANHNLGVAQANFAVAESRKKAILDVVGTEFPAIDQRMRKLDASVEARRTLAETSRQMIDALEKTAPDDLDVRKLVAASYSWLSDVTGGMQGGATGAVADAIALGEKSIATFRDLIKSSPGDDSLRQRYVGALIRHAEALRNGNRVADALAVAADAVTISDTLGAESGRHRRHALSERGSAALELKQLPQARADFEQVLTMIETLPLPGEPAAHADARRDRSVAHRNLGRILEEEGDIAAAAVHYRTSLQERILVRDTIEANERSRRDAANASLSLGRCLLKLKTAEGDTEAAQYLNQALVELKPLAAASPDDQRLQGDVAQALWDVGRLTRKSDPFGALSSYRGALELARLRLAADPANTRYLVMVVGCTDGAAMLIDDAGEMISLVREGLAAADRLVTANARYARNYHDLAKRLVAVLRSSSGDAAAEAQAEACTLRLLELARGGQAEGRTDLLEQAAALAGLCSVEARRASLEQQINDLQKVAP